MKKVLGLFVILLLMAACGGNKPTQTETLTATIDSIQKTDTIDSIHEEETPPPAAADGLFDDFSYNFMRNKSFQKQRVKFPLLWNDNGTEKTITEKEWKFTPLYIKRDVYTMIFDSEKTMAHATDTALKNVVVEMINLKTSTVKEYVFEKLRGAWMLTRISTESMAKNANSDFLAFYARFAKDKTYQQQSVSATFGLSVIDGDTEERITGIGEAAQWFSYSPEFPTDEITNVNYGQKYAPAGGRVFVVNSTDGAMSSIVTFAKKRGKWMVTKLENN